MIRAVRSVFQKGLMVIIRPRGYDFLYSEHEMEAMLHDIAVARDLGADGVVIGCLTAHGRVDRQRCGKLMEAAGPLDVTFHRAFDMTRDLDEALEDIVSLGIRRILSSGGQPDVPSGIPVLSRLVKLSAGRVSLMPGGGVTETNIPEVVAATGVREVHLSARSPVTGGMEFFNAHCHMGSFTKDNEYAWKEADPAKIRLAKGNLTQSLAR